MSSIFLAITSVSAGVSARLAGASAAASSAAAATQPMPILVMICLPPTPFARHATSSRHGAGRPAGPASAGGEGMAAIIARDRPDAQQKAVRREPAAVWAGRSDHAAATARFQASDALRTALAAKA